MTSSANVLDLSISSADITVSAGALDLTLGADDTAVNAGNLSLPLTNNDRPNAGELPLPLGQVGTGGDTGGDTGGGDTDPPPLPRLKIPSLASCFDIVTSSYKTIANCQKLTTSRSKTILNDTDISTKASVTVINCQFVKTINYVNISNCHQFTNSHTRQINKCQYVFVATLFNISNCQKATVSAIKTVENCNQINTQPTQTIAHCQKVDTVAVEQIKHCLDVKNYGVSIASLHDVTVQPAIPVPCRYYPLPPPPVVKPNTGACRIRPPASDLPLMLGQRQAEMPASDLPLNLTCWHDTPSQQIPNKDTYIMHTIITATIGGIAVEPLSFSIATDMNSYCWSGSVSISPDDFAKIESKLNVPVGEEPIVTVIINNERFSFIAEKSSRIRSFANHRHKIWGRSITTRLGSDYAIANDRLFDQDNYAKQIVNEQLQNFPFIIEEWSVNDWFIPAKSYSVSNKTPIDVIAEIAEAVGGFVESHKYDAKLSIKKRWKANAWELDTATPDIIMPADPSFEITDTPIPAPRYNAVMVMSDIVAHNIHRSTQGRDKIAPTVNHALYTDQAVTIPKGSAILSDSGKHNIYQIKMIWGDGVELAELGQIWQFNDLDGSWRGVVTGIKVTVELNNDAPVVYQTVILDKYLDN